VRAILEYMYKGEVSVSQEELPALLRVAELLRVKGMVEEEEERSANTASAATATAVVKKEAKEPPPPTPTRPRTSSPPTATPSRSSSPMRTAEGGCSSGGQLMIPISSSASSGGGGTAAHTSSSGSSRQEVGPPPHHLPPNFRPFLTSPAGPTGSHTPPFPMWPLPGLFPGAHNIFSPRDSVAGGGGAGGGRVGSPGLKESRGRLNSGQDKDLPIPPLMPRDSLEEKQVSEFHALQSSGYVRVLQGKACWGGFSSARQYSC
jgi:hypothetical protein